MSDTIDLASRSDMPLRTALDGSELLPALAGETPVAISVAALAEAVAPPTPEPPAWADIADRPETFPPAAHSHAMSDVTGLTDALDAKANAVAVAAALADKADADAVASALAGKAPLNSPAMTGIPTAPTADPETDSDQIATTAFVTAAIDAIPDGEAVDWGDIENLPTEFPPSAHSHAMSDVTGLTGALNGKFNTTGGTITGSTTVSTSSSTATLVLKSGTSGGSGFPITIGRTNQSYQQYTFSLDASNNLVLTRNNPANGGAVHTLASFGFDSNITTFGGNVTVSGTLSKASGTFLIDHPLDPENKDLAHGFVEAPRYDLIYRGVAALVDGEAEVDIDAASGMSAGTFDALTTYAVVASLNNLSSFARVRSLPVSAGKFRIVCEDAGSVDDVAWVVLAERNDPYVKVSDHNCDSNGRLIPEREKPDYVQP